MSQVQREGQVAMDALRRCAEASERRRTAGKEECANRHHGQLMAVSNRGKRKQREEREGEREGERERGSEGKRERGKEGERIERQRGREERGREGAANS